MGLQFKNIKTNRVYMVWEKKDKLGRRMFRPYYSDSGHLRVVPGTKWQRYEVDAEDDLRSLAAQNGWKRD